MNLTLSQRFTFDAAHTLQRGESSKRIHGHTYHAELSMTGVPDDETGMVTDLENLKNVAEGIRDELDHRFLDEVEGLGPAPLENLCAFIYRKVRRYPCFTGIRVWRADGGACGTTWEWKGASKS